VADRKGYGSVPGCRKRIYNVNSNDHRSTKFELLLYKEVEAITGGDRELHELLVLRKGLLLASAWSSEARMTRMSARGHQKAANWHCGRGGILKEESIVHTVYTAPRPNTPAFSSDILTLQDGTNKLS
jgi:hypothetical protein